MQLISESTLLDSNRVFAVVGDYSKLNRNLIQKSFANARYLLICFRGMPDLPLRSAVTLLSLLTTSFETVLVCNMEEAATYPLVAQTALDYLIEKTSYVFNFKWCSHDLPLAAAQYSDRTFALGSTAYAVISSQLNSMGYTGDVILIP